MKVAMQHMKGLILVGCLLVCCLVAAGCSASSEPASNEPSIPTFGEASDTSLSITFTNETNAEITDIAIVPAGSTDELVFMFEEGQVFGEGEQIILNVEPYDEQTLFDVTIVIGEDNFTLHNLDFATTDEVTIYLEGDVAYLEVMIDGAPVSTLREEYDIVHPLLVEPDDAVDEPADVAEEPVYENYQYDAGVGQSEDTCVEGGVVLR